MDEPPPPPKELAEVIEAATGRISRAPLQDLRDATHEAIGGYEIHEELGSGGSGTVYVASDPRHEREVALKLFLESSEHAKQRFQREIDAVSRLRHPHIVPLFDSGESNGCLYMVMELIDGSSLARHADRWLGDEDQHPDMRTIATSVRDAARAIHYAHSEGILHRDLKPHNLLLDRHGETHVTDFGLALDLEGLDEKITRTGSSLGTPAYMAPEQVNTKRHRIDARTDVYALGATLFHVATGHTPFEHVPAAEMLFAIFRAPPPLPSRINPKVPPQLDAVILRCMEKEPALRYPSAAALADDLDRFLAGEPVEAERPGVLERLKRAVLRRPLVAGLALALALLMLAFVLVVVRYEQLLRSP